MCHQSITVSTLGDGNNVIPMIHVRDLSSMLALMVERRPSPDQQYIVATDTYVTHAMCGGICFGLVLFIFHGNRLSCMCH
jgi:hypothetical protein